MSRRLALFCYLGLTVAAVALWFDEAIRGAFRGLRVDCTACPCGAS